MKASSAVRWFGLALATIPEFPTQAQTLFKNLDFEMAQAPFDQFSTALPYWQGMAGGTANPSVFHDGLLLDSPEIALYDAASGTKPIGGNFMAVLMADAGFWPSSKAELFQSGFIPTDAKSIQFATTTTPLLQGDGAKPGTWKLSLLVNGANVPFSQLEVNSTLTLWGADISQDAGTTAEIRFSLDTWGTPGGDPGIAFGLDNIAFSPTQVPEPSALTLLAFGLTVFVWRRLEVRLR